MVDLSKYVDKINLGLLTDESILKVLEEVYYLGFDDSKKDTLKETLNQLGNIIKPFKKKED